jgi:cyclic pyranopterin phosphate synthase
MLNTSVSSVPEGVPVHVSRDTTLRVKIGDPCGFTCTFCHNEGTPVTSDNRGGLSTGIFRPSGPSGRVSIYTKTNGVGFLAAPMPADESFRRALSQLRDAMGYTEIHLTGGEPTLHPQVAQLIKIATDEGLTVGMTSNGENGARVLPDCARAGLDRVNFSIFGTTPAELAEVQHARYRNPKLAEVKINSLHRAIAECERNGVKASANIVVLDYSHAQRVHRLLDDYSHSVSVRLLNSLGHGTSSNEAIRRILAERGAEPIAHYITAGVSGSRTAYRLPDGRTVYFKQIRSARLPETCASCRFNNPTDCQEGFYGVRLYYDTEKNFRVGVCIQRMDLTLPLSEFLRSGFREEVLTLREAEYEQYTAS